MSPHHLGMRFLRLGIAPVGVLLLALRSVETSPVLLWIVRDYSEMRAASPNKFERVDVEGTVVGDCSAAVARRVGGFVAVVGYGLLVHRWEEEEDRRSSGLVEDNAVHSFVVRSPVRLVEEAGMLRVWSVEESQ